MVVRIVHCVVGFVAEGSGGGGGGGEKQLQL